MIDPVETVIRFLSDDATLSAMVGGRVAAKHRYGEAWQTSQASVMARLDGGPVDVYVPVQTPRFEVRCYAPSQVEAMRIWARLVELSRATERGPVTVSNGMALLYAWLQESGPSLLYDSEVALDFVLCFFAARIGELTV